MITVSTRCASIVSSEVFQLAVTIVVLVASVQVGLETSVAFRAEHVALLTTIDLLVTVAFAVEIAIRLLADIDHPVKAVTRPLNLFDLLLVVGALVPLTAGLFSILRLFRLLRVLRLVRMMPKLQLLIAATLNSIPSILSISVLLGMFFYVYSVAGVFLFSANDPIHFRNLPTSLLSLFRVITLEDWTDIMYIQVYGCANYGYDNFRELCQDSTSYGALGAMFFVTFVFIGTWVVLNLFIGIILTGMDDARREVESTPLAPTRTIQLLRQLRRGVVTDAGAILLPTPAEPILAEQDLATVGAIPGSHDGTNGELNGKSQMRRVGNGMVATRRPEEQVDAQDRNGNGERNDLEAQLLTLEAQIRLLREQVRQDRDNTP